MKVAVQMHGLNGLKKSMGALHSEMKDELDAALIQAGFRIQREAVKSIQAHRSKGATYGNHTASRAGFPPNSDTGLLAKSIYVENDKDTTDRARVFVGTNLKYGQWLEHGTTEMAARPWLHPAFEKMFKKNVEAMKRVVASAIKRLGFGATG